MSHAHVAQLLRAADHVSVVSHLRPDADTIGSAAALIQGLRQIGVSADGFVDGPIPDNLHSIPGSEFIGYGELPAGGLIVAVDCGSLDRTGRYAEQIENRRQDVVVIDHHATNQGFGEHNLLERTESTTVIVYDVLTELGVQLNRDIAHALYAGLMTDTGSFRWGSPRMHQLAGELIQYNLDTRQIAVDLLDSTTAGDVHMVGRVLAGAQVRRSGHHVAAILIADQETIEGHSESAVESLVDFIRAVEGTDCGAVFKEIAFARWAVSLRSSTWDVSRLAEKLGGGGHVPSAGYTDHGSREDVVARFLRALADS
ncbi:DHH family phosphoesterase [Corynebacterium tapiri]|uniref:Bifunctional oligoribonuclease/PAP phosphatase NrnA n=1 Tax=Corynebacterium tapiri TaxID=1448266 RepID=A0A5C4U670_9CORY|nr:bifunctional oligoribonuclease/PAP phosphatase NrnA [Corynebacterium tapiri]TNL99264.1 bifunctional oligoribonuclease/PAP phosphatase NrnA [Corynebacterium tapiri]